MLRSVRPTQARITGRLYCKTTNLRVHICPFISDVASSQPRDCVFFSLFYFSIFIRGFQTLRQGGTGQWSSRSRALVLVESSPCRWRGPTAAEHERRGLRRCPVVKLQGGGARGDASSLVIFLSFSRVCCTWHVSRVLNILK